MQSNNVPKVKAFLTEFYGDRPCIGIYDTEIEGVLKFIINHNGGVLVKTPPIDKTMLRFLPHNEHKGKTKWIIPVDQLEVIEEEAIEEKDNVEVQLDGNILLNIMLLFPREVIIDAITEYTKHERETAKTT